MAEESTRSRRTFVAGATVAGAAATLAGSAPALGRPRNRNGKVRSLAAFDDSGTLQPFEFERRPVGPDDIVIDIAYASICHSDIHQEKGDWGPQQYPQVPGHEIVGIVSAVGDNVTDFAVGDRAGVGCMVDSCMECESCTHGEEHHCQRGETLFTYGYPDEREPTGITQGGYSTQIVVRSHFAVHIPDHITLQEAAPLLCAGITTYSPFVQANFDVGDKVAIIGIGGLGHLAVKLAVSRGAKVTAFTTSPGKVADIESWGATAVVVEEASDLAPHRGTFDWALSTVPVQYDITSYAALVKPHHTFSQVGMPAGMQLPINVIALSMSRVKVDVSLIGGIPQTQEVVHYCADNNVRPVIQVISAEEVNDAWESVVGKQARYRYVIDASSF